MSFLFVLKYFVRYNIFYPARFIFSGGLLCKKRILIATNRLVGSIDPQLDPFFIFSKKLGIELGASVLVADIAAAKIFLCLFRFDLVGIKLHYTLAPHEVYRSVCKFRSLSKDACLVYFDNDDDVCIQFKEVLEVVDFYVKGHIFSNPSDYTISRIGKNNLTDYIAKKYGVDFSNDPIPSSEAIPEALLHKIVLGFTIGLSARMMRIALPSSSNERPIDILCRASLGSGSWITPLREPLIPLLADLSSHWSVLSPSQRVTPEQYAQEMISAKICISPLGYGEICWRDFESVIYGCVLMKPDMSHVKARPDIFIPFQTYVPIKWDFSDLEEKCSWCLNHPEECQRIVANARSVLEACFTGNDFIAHVKELLDRNPPTSW